MKCAGGRTERRGAGRGSNEPPPLGTDLGALHHPHGEGPDHRHPLAVPARRGPMRSAKRRNRNVEYTGTGNAINGLILEKYESYNWTGKKINK